MAHVNYLGLTPVIPVVTDDSTLVGQGTYYPIGFTKEEWVYFYWKVKLFGFRGSASWTHPVVPGVTPPGDTGTHSLSTPGLVAPLSYQENVTFNPTSERDLICRHWTETSLYTQYSPINDGIVEYGWQAIRFGAPFLHALNPEVPEVNCYYYNGLYYPFFQFVAQIGEITITSGLRPDADFSINLSFLGKRLTLGAFLNGANYGVHGTIVNSSTLEIYAAEEWSYQ